LYRQQLGAPRPQGKSASAPLACGNRGPRQHPPLCLTPWRSLPRPRQVQHRHRQSLPLCWVLLAPSRSHPSLPQPNLVSRHHAQSAVTCPPLQPRRRVPAARSPAPPRVPPPGPAQSCAARDDGASSPLDSTPGSIDSSLMRAIFPSPHAAQAPQAVVLGSRRLARVRIYSAGAWCRLAPVGARQGSPRGYILPSPPLTVSAPPSLP